MRVFMILSTCVLPCQNERRPSIVLEACELVLALTAREMAKERGSETERGRGREKREEEGGSDTDRHTDRDRQPDTQTQRHHLSPLHFFSPLFCYGISFVQFRQTWPMLVVDCAWWIPRLLPVRAQQSKVHMVWIFCRCHCHKSVECLFLFECTRANSLPSCSPLARQLFHTKATMVCTLVSVSLSVCLSVSVSMPLSMEKKGVEE